MKKMQIFEPAMCCSTGLCGVSIDPELLRISTLLDALKKKDILVDRFNLTSAPMEFVNNKIINDFLNEQGAEKLPVTILDGDIVVSGRYPMNEEFIKYLELSDDVLQKDNEKKSEGCCCEGCCC